MLFSGLLERHTIYSLFSLAAGVATRGVAMTSRRSRARAADAADIPTIYALESRRARRGAPSRHGITAARITIISQGVNADAAQFTRGDGLTGVLARDILIRAIAAAHLFALIHSIRASA